MAKLTGMKMMTTRVVIKTVYGTELTTAQEKAYNTLKRLIEKEEAMARKHGMADVFRSYFKKDYISE